MRLLLLLLLSSLLPAQSAPDLLAGAWVNPDQNTRGVTEVTITRNGARLQAHAWGACRPTDCDWGEADAELWNGIPMAIWKHGFSTVRMQLIPQPDGRLLVAYRTEYQDGSGRVDKGTAEFLVRSGEQTPSASEAAAKAVLEAAANRYRTLPAAYFESTTTAVRKAGNSESRRVTRLKLHYLPPDKLHTEIDDGREPYVEMRDGKTEWRIFTAAGEYFSMPQGKDPLGNSALGTFALLGLTRGTPAITGHESVDGASCSVVRLKLERGVTQTYWIDDTSHLVRRMTEETGDTSHSEIIFTTVRLGDRADSARSSCFTGRSGTKDWWLWVSTPSHPKQRVNISRRTDIRFRRWWMKRRRWSINST